VQHAVEQPNWPVARWGSPAKPAPMAGGNAVLPLKPHRRRCSGPWQTQETPCHFHPESAQKSEWPREAAPIDVVLFRVCGESRDPLTILYTILSWASHGPNAYRCRCKPRFLAVTPVALPGNPAARMESTAFSDARANFSRNYDPGLENYPKVQGFSLLWQFRCLFR